MELEIIKAIQSIHSNILDNFAQGVTMLGEQYFYFLFLVIVFWNINKRFGYKLGFILISNGVINGAIKDLVQAKRPIGVEGVRSLRIQTATGSSFPSGHSQGAGGFWFFLMVEFKKRWIYIVGTILMLMVGLSRIYLGVHWPKDVAAGLVIGIFWVYLGGKLFDYSIKKNSKHILLFFILPSLIGMFFFKSSDYLKTAAIAVGFYIGYVIEDKYINFKEKAALKIQVFKFLIGAAGLVIIMVFLKELMPNGNMNDFIRYSLLGVWITSGAPFIFTRIFPSSRGDESEHAMN